MGGRSFIVKVSKLACPTFISSRSSQKSPSLERSTQSPTPLRCVEHIFVVLETQIACRGVQQVVDSNLLILITSLVRDTITYRVTFVVTDLGWVGLNFDVLTSV